MLLEYIDPEMRVEIASAKLRGQTITKTMEVHDRNLHRMPANYRRMVRLAREEAETDVDPDSLIKHSGFRPFHPGDEPSGTDDWAKATSETAPKPNTKQDKGA